MSLTPADKVRIQQLRDSGALTEIFDAVRFQLYEDWCKAGGTAREEAWCKQSVLRDIQREFNKAADGVDNG